MFLMTPKKNIIQMLKKENWAGYMGNLPDDSRNISMLFEKVEKLSGCCNIKSLMNRSSLIAIGQMLGISGYVGQYGIITEKVDLKKHGVNLKKNFSWFDLESLQMAEINTWFQKRFLIFHLCFLIDCHVRVDRNFSFDFAPSVQLDKERFLKILTNQIWITVNAYRIYCSYMEINGRVKEREEHQKALMSAYLNEILQSWDTREYEYCFPCGYAGHDIYLNIIDFRKKKCDQGDKHELIIRIDNSSEENARILHTDINNIASKKNLISYLSNVASVSHQGKEIARKIIYDKGRRSGLREIKMNDYPEFGRLIAPSCAVEGFYRRQYHAMDRIDPSCEVYEWLHCSEQMFVVQLRHHEEQVQKALKPRVIYRKSKRRLLEDPQGMQDKNLREACLFQNLIPLDKGRRAANKKGLSQQGIQKLFQQA